MNASDLINTNNLTPITDLSKTSLSGNIWNIREKYLENNPLNNLNNNSTAIDLAKANAEFLKRQNIYKYFHDEALANTAVQRRVNDLIHAGLNPYLANGLIGASGFGGEIPNSAASAMSGENRQKLDWKAFAAQTGANLIQNIIQIAMTGMSIYTMKKALSKDDKEIVNYKDTNNNIGFFPNQKEIEKLGDDAKKMIGILGGMFGLPNFNWNF